MSLLSSFFDPRTIRSLGITRTLRGLRSGDQSLLLTGISLAILGWLRSRPKGDRELLATKVVPLGSSIVIRHTGVDGDSARIEVIEPGAG